MKDNNTNDKDGKVFETFEETEKEQRPKAKRKFTPYRINKRKTKLTEKGVPTLNGRQSYVEMDIWLDKPHDHEILGFYYFIRDSDYKRKKKCSSQMYSEENEIEALKEKYNDDDSQQEDSENWATIDDIGNHECKKVSYKEYCRRGKIHCQFRATKQESYYISVFTIYDLNGQEMVVGPSKHEVFRPLIVDILWKVEVNRQSIKLVVEVLGNRPVDHLPSMALVKKLNTDGAHEECDEDDGAVIVVEEDHIDPPATQRHMTFERQIYCDYKQYKELRNSFWYLQIKGDTGQDKYTTRWKEGFLGKA